MGQSLSISYGLLVLCTLLVGSMLYSAYQASSEIITEAEDKDYEREFDRIHTQIELINASMDPDEQRIHLIALNTGSIMIHELGDMDIFTNATENVDCGIYTHERWVPSSSLGAAIIAEGCYWSYSLIGDTSYNPDFWDPNEYINITITFSSIISQQSYFYKISTPNGVVDSFQYNTVV